MKDLKVHYTLLKETTPSETGLYRCGEEDCLVDWLVFEDRLAEHAWQEHDKNDFVIDKVEL
jgi:hypothetical protein